MLAAIRINLNGGFHIGIRYPLIIFHFCTGVACCFFVGFYLVSIVALAHELPISTWEHHKTLVFLFKQRFNFFLWCTASLTHYAVICCLRVLSALTQTAKRTERCIAWRLRLNNRLSLGCALWLWLCFLLCLHRMHTARFIHIAIKMLVLCLIGTSTQPYQQHYKPS